MLRLWLTRRWLVATAVAIAFGVACWFAGAWQWERHVEQRTKVRAIEQNYTAAPMPLGEALARLDGQVLTPERQWTRVTAIGTYVPGAQLMVRNRTLDQTVGFEVLTPLDTDSGTILVDRGWVPNATDAETTPPADPAPTGLVTVTGWLRSGEPALGRDLPAPQLASIDLGQARSHVPGLSPVEAYVLLGSQSPASASAAHPVVPLPPPDEGLGPHQAYAFQWWIFMPGGLVFILFALRREAAALDLGERPERPRKVRIWDEEDA